jgi:hypothetical protein
MAAAMITSSLRTRTSTESDLRDSFAAREGRKEKKKKKAVSPIQQTIHRIACKNCHSRVYLCRQLHYLLRLQIFSSCFRV